MKITVFPLTSADFVVIAGVRLTFARLKNGKLVNHVTVPMSERFTSAMFCRCLTAVLNYRRPQRVLLFLSASAEDQQLRLITELLTSYCLGKEIPLLILPSVNELLRVSIKPAMPLQECPREANLQNQRSKHTFLHWLIRGGRDEAGREVTPAA